MLRYLPKAHDARNKAVYAFWDVSPTANLYIQAMFILSLSLAVCVPVTWARPVARNILLTELMSASMAIWTIATFASYFIATCCTRLDIVSVEPDKDWSTFRKQNQMRRVLHDWPLKVKHYCILAGFALIIGWLVVFIACNPAWFRKVVRTPQLVIVGASVGYGIPVLQILIGIAAVLHGKYWHKTRKPMQFEKPGEDIGVFVPFGGFGGERAVQKREVKKGYLLHLIRSAKQHFKGNQIVIALNGRPLTDEQHAWFKREILGDPDGAGVQYVVIPDIGNKNFALYTATVTFQSHFRRVLILDDDTILGEKFMVPSPSEGTSFAYPLYVVHRPGNVYVSAIGVMYDETNLFKELMFHYQGSVLRHHGPISLWDIDELKSTLEAHDLEFNTEDLQMGLIAFLRGRPMKHVHMEYAAYTYTMETLDDYYKQRVHSWNLGLHRHMGTMAHVCFIALGRCQFGLAFMAFMEFVHVFAVSVWVPALIWGFYVRPGYTAFGLALVLLASTLFLVFHVCCRMSHLPQYRGWDFVALVLFWPIDCILRLTFDVMAVVRFFKFESFPRSFKALRDSYLMQHPVLKQKLEV